MPDFLIHPVVLIGVPLLAALIGFFLGVLFQRGQSGGENPAEIDESEEADDPTAPIAPMVEMGRSPHDIHRDLAVGKSLIQQIDFIDSMEKSARSRRDDETVRQLLLLRNEFVETLRHCSVEALSYPSGTPVDTEIRGRIQIVGGSRAGERTVIAETVSPGYLYLHGDDDSSVLRKAEVKIG